MSERKIRVVRPDDDVHVIRGAGDVYRVLATGATTDGQYFLVDGFVPPGGGPPAHIQNREEEAFYVLEGTVTFYGDDGEIEAGPGTYLNIPKGAKHRFRNNTEQDARLLFWFVPSGLEEFFDELAASDEPDDMAAALDRFNKIGERYGLQFFEN